MPKNWSRITVERLDDDVAIESELHYGDMLAYVTIDGSEPLRMLVDTGSPVHSVTESAAVKLGLNETGTLLLGDYVGNVRHCPYARVGTMRLGGYAFQDLDLLILPDRLDDRVDGIMGMLGMRDLTLDLNFSTGEMRLTHERLSKDDPGVLPFRQTHDKGILVPFQLIDSNGIERTYWAQLDTGHSGSLLLHPTPTLVSLDRDELISRSIVSGALDVMWVTEYYRTYGPIRIGGISYEGVPTGANMASNNIGVEMLEGCQVSIDWVSKLVRIRRVDGATRLVVRKTLGFYGMFADDGGFRASVIPGSIPDQSGLTTHHLVTKINGMEVDERFDSKDLWPIPMEATEVIIEYIDPKTNELATCTIPIESD